MILKRYILLILCLLAMRVEISAQTLLPDSSEWDFGTIEEEGGSVSHRFELRNDGDVAVVIRSVRTSCGCTTSEYTRRPITPGGVGELLVTFDPRFRPGHFSKDVYIYSTASEEPLVIKINGRVTPRVPSIEEWYPYIIGQGLRIAMTYVAVMPLMKGELVQRSVEYTNTSDKPIEIEFRKRHANEDLSLFYDGGVAAGEQTQVEIGYFTDLEGDISAVRRDTLDIYINGEDSGRALYIKGVVEE